jgi:hypothetical protein
MTEPTAAAGPPGQIRFVAGYQPGLPAGTYDVSASQDVSAHGAAVGTVAPATHRMVVSGPRFALDPGDIHAEYPPAAASGAFGQVLPHVVFTKRLLPWERQLPAGDQAGTPGPPAPWLALLVFQPGELLISDGDPATAATAGYAATMTVSQLLAQDPAAVRVPRLTPVTDEAAMSCQVISITNATFASVVPTRRELPFLAHGREVDVAGKSLLDMYNPGQFSIVVANRFPLPGTAAAGVPCIAHLVSLEGFGDLLTGTAPARPPQPTVKLVSLFSWTFGCLQDDSQTFRGLARNLALDGTTPRPAQALRLSLPFTASGATDPATVTVNTRLLDGYLALGYHTRTGDDGFAWYRGPLTPSVPRPAFAPGTFPTSDAAMIFDSGTGVFDLSLAAAWECGRSLALADQAYAGALMRLRQQKRSQLHYLTSGDADLPGGIGPAQAALAAVIHAGALQQVGAAAAGADLPRLARRPAGPPAPAPVQRLRALLARPAVKAALTGGLDDNPDAVAVAARLGQLSLLEGIPFDHLVPDARMLPPESARFCYLDQGWISAMIDGALAIGQGTTEDSSLQHVLTEQLVAMAAQSALAARATVLGLPVPPAPAGPTAAILIRSALVTGWPGVVVRGVLAGADVPLLRLDAVRPDVLVGVFAGVPDTAAIEEPHESLAFGVTLTGKIWKIVTRTVAGSTITDGPEMNFYDPDAPASVPSSLRPGGARVLNLNSDPAYPSQQPPGTPLDLLGLIAHGLQTGTVAITPATFALQMVLGAAQLTFSQLPSDPREVS